jgi:serine/threonine protein phosphatase 1
VDWLLWRRIHDAQWPHESGKTMICGHTAQRSGLPLVMPHAVCIDTWAFGEGWLTGYDVHANVFVQANQAGETRRFGPEFLADG